MGGLDFTISKIISQPEVFPSKVYNPIGKKSCKIKQPKAWIIRFLILAEQEGFAVFIKQSSEVHEGTEDKEILSPKIQGQ